MLDCTVQVSGGVHGTILCIIQQYFYPPFLHMPHNCGITLNFLMVVSRIAKQPRPMMSYPMEPKSERETLCNIVRMPWGGCLSCGALMCQNLSPSGGLKTGCSVQSLLLNSQPFRCSNLTYFYTEVICISLLLDHHELCISISVI